MRKIVLTIAVLLLIVSAGYCQTQPLQITIKSDKQVYEVGEEIVVNVKLKNISSETVTMSGFVGALDFDNFFHFHCWDSHGTVGYVEKRVLEKISFVELKPNSFAEGRYALKTQAEKLLSPFFRGRLSIEATFRYNIPSNVIIIEMKEDNYKGISREQALETARKLCEDSGWEWGDVSTIEEKYKWIIKTNTNSDNNKAFIHIDKATGAIEETFGPQ